MKKISIILILFLLIINMFLLIENANLRNEASITNNVDNVIQGISSDLTEVVEKTSSSIVSIETDLGLGSGFIFDCEDGIAYILTNYHVIENNSHINVYLANGITFLGDIVGYDEILDVAVLAIKCDYNLNTLPLGDSDKLKMGEFVIKFGLEKNLKLSNSVGFGMVSSNFRNLIYEIDNQEHYLNFIQTDLRLNEGNSGGPLINMIGEVIGLNTISKDGISLSIPSNHLTYLVRDLMDDGKLSRLLFDIDGIAIKDMDNYQKAKCNLMLDDEEGIYVNDVLNNSLASKLDIKEGDIIYKINSTIISSYKDYLMLSYNVKGNYIVEVIRQGEHLLLEGEND